MNILVNTPLDVNICTNTNTTIAIGQLIDNILELKNERLPLAERHNERYSIAKQQVVDWWLQRIDRIHDVYINPYLPWLAAENKVEAILNLCSRPTIDLDILANDGFYAEYTALIKAAEGGFGSIVDILLQYYPTRLHNLNQQTSYGYTALILASMIACVDIVRRLCGIADTDLNIEDCFGDTALIIAACNGCTSVIDELLQYAPTRLNVNQQTSYGDTALTWASKRGHDEIVRRLCGIADTDSNNVAYSENSNHTKTPTH